MANENLKHALENAGLTPEEFADVIRVDPKSVQRWVTGTTTPYPRHRAAISRALDLAEHELWPDDIPSPPPGTSDRELNASAGNEITRTWAYADDDSVPDAVALISSGNGAIELLDNGTGIELTTTLAAALLARANGGHEIRLLTCAPTRRLKPLTGDQHIEIRVTQGTVGHSLIRVGDTMLLTFNIAADGLQPPPLLKLTRTFDGRLFDRLADNLDALWDDAEETITNPQQIDAYLSSDQDDEGLDEEQEWTGRSAPGDRPEPRSSDATEPAVTLIPSEPDRAPRRWPGRSD